MVVVVGLAGGLWFVVDMIRGEEPSYIALWMMLSVLGFGLLLNVTLGALLLGERLRRKGRADDDAEDA